MSTVAKHLIIHGRVQGVAYRAWMVSEAQTHGVSGWVRNVHDSTVEAVVSGEEEDVQAVIDACYNGPAMANVTDIDAYDCAPPEHNGFAQCASV